MPQFKHAKVAAQVDGGTVKGYASTFDREPDSYGDVIAPGAFAKSLERWAALYEQGKRIPLLYGHNTDDPMHNIGWLESVPREDERGLFVEGRFDPENETAQYVRKLAQEGRIYQFSFAFTCTDWAEVTLEDGRKANELRELDIYEVSLVQIPANQHAEVTEVKAAEVKSGRRNSAKDEGELRAIAEAAASITTIVNGLLADSAPDEREPEPEANPEEPERANGEEPKGIGELLAKAEAILEKGETK